MRDEDRQTLKAFLANEKARAIRRHKESMDGLTTAFGILAAMGTACAPILQQNGYPAAAMVCTVMASASLAAWGFLTNKAKK